jgi:hypothetical protein
MNQIEHVSATIITHASSYIEILRFILGQRPTFWTFNCSQCVQSNVVMIIHNAPPSSTVSSFPFPVAVVRPPVVYCGTAGHCYKK